MKYFFWYYLNTTVRKFNICAVHAIQKKFVYLHQMGEQIKSSLLIKMLLQQVYSYFSFHFPTIQIFISMGKKLWIHISFSSTGLCYYRKHLNNDDNEICPLLSYSCFQQHFHDWFYVLRYNSDLSKLEWTLLLVNFS